MSNRQIVAPMDPNEFIRKWGLRSSASKLNERAGAQAHFIDLCRLLEVAEPVDPEQFCFERSFHRHNKALGYADVWKRGCFAWEYKAPGRSLDDALGQLMQYALPLENPPLFVVSDREHYEIHTHFTGYASDRITFVHGDLIHPETRAKLRSIFSDPYSFRPGRTSVEITKHAAKGFAAIAERMQDRGVAPHQAAHFLTQCLFCMFAQDAGLLRTDLFKALTTNKHDAESLQRGLTRLFTVMRTGGDFGVENIAWFNGGLFEVVAVPALATEDVDALRAAASLDWRGLDPSIFGTLFERGLDPRKRKQLGAHYTDPATILKLVIPVVERPLLTAWSRVKAEIAQLMEQRDSLRNAAAKIPSTTKAEQAKHSRKRSSAKAAEELAQDLFNGYLQHLRDFRVLDPACGSGNFLYVALRTLKDIEHRVNLEAEGLGLHRQLPLTGPQNVLGLEVNAYAAELSRVTVWIGELQWRMQHGFGWKTNPILDPLDQIECRDALLNKDGSEAQWPIANVIIGNPPFVGVGRKRRELGDTYVKALDHAFSSRIPGASDLVCYWFDKALTAIKHRGLGAAGLVATNSIRGGANRTVLESITRDSRIFEAWSDEAWVNDGAAVRVSLVCFGKGEGAHLSGHAVPQIYADLTAPSDPGDSLDVSRAATLLTNVGASFQGASKKAKFEINETLAREWLRLPNPNGRSNSDVVKPWANGFELSRRPQGQWIIDFGNSMSEEEASLYEKPFEYVVRNVKPERVEKSEVALRDLWWRFGRPRVEMREAIKNLPRFIATIAHSKYRFFVWLPITTSPDQALITVARADEVTLGLLHSRLHELWSLRVGTSIGVGNDPRYTPTTCFETFPFPYGLTPADTAHQRTDVLSDGSIIPSNLRADVRSHAEAIARATKRLNDLRDRWLNPPEWVSREPEVVPLGMRASPYPDRILPMRTHEKDLAQRTMTNLYNARPLWLLQAHEALDAAVASAYGWKDYSTKMSDEEVLRRLLAENLQRAQGQTGAQVELPFIDPLADHRKAMRDGSLVQVGPKTTNRRTRPHL